MNPGSLTPEGCAPLDAKYPSEGGATDLLLSSKHNARERALSVWSSPPGKYANTQNITITLDLEAEHPGTDDPALASADIIAIIGYGVGGARHTVEIDWKRGAQVTVPASHVDVGAFFQDVLTPLWPQARLRVSASYGTRPTRGIDTRTSLRQTVFDGGAEVLFESPRMFYAVNVAFTVVARYAAGMTFRAHAGTAAASEILLELDGTDLRAALRGEGITLPGATKSIGLLNATGANAFARAVWAISV